MIRCLMSSDKPEDTTTVKPFEPSRSEAVEFHLREHATLRTEIESDKQHLRKLETYSLIGTGTVWAWLATAPKDLPTVLWLMPFLFVAFGGFQTWGMIRDINDRVSYLCDLESSFEKLSFESKCGLQQLAGWENYMAGKRRSENRKPSRLNQIFWFSLSGITMGIWLWALSYPIWMAEP